MNGLEKGFIVSIEDNKARVKNISKSTLVTTLIVVPWWLRNDRGNLEIGTEVIYCIFEDNTGIILSRSDGEYFEIGE